MSKIRTPSARRAARRAAAARATQVRTRALEVLQFFDAGGSICPFAQAAVRAPAGVVIVQLAHLDEDEVLLGLLSAFTSTTMAAIVVAPTDPPSHAEARALAEQLFGRLTLACYRLNYPLARIDRRQVLQGAQLALADPHRHAVLHLHRSPLFIVAMGPAYRPGHPRHAPHLCAVLTWQADVVRSSQTRPDLTSRIRDAMQARTGALYDAVTFYLEER